MGPLLIYASFGAVSFCLSVLCDSRMQRSKYFARCHEIDNMVYTESLLEQVKVKSNQHCLSQCNIVKGCSCALFHPDSNQCRLYEQGDRDVMNKTHDQLGWQGWCSMFRKKTFGDHCSNSHECNYQHGLCLRGSCSCVIGYSYNFHKDECVTDCSSYGSDFSMYKDSGVEGCNVIFFLRVPTQETCLQRCRNEPSFVCISCEYDTTSFLGKFSRCNLCNETWSNIDESKRNVGKSPKWLFFYRHCQNV